MNKDPSHEKIREEFEGCVKGMEDRPIVGRKKEAVEKIFFLTENQFNDICVDLYEEIGRRKSKKSAPLESKKEYGAKRNMVREQLSFLEEGDLKNLVHDTLLVLRHKHSTSSEDRLECLDSLVRDLQTIVSSNTPCEEPSPAANVKYHQSEKNRIMHEPDAKKKADHFFTYLKSTFSTHKIMHEDILRHMEDALAPVLLLPSAPCPGGERKGAEQTQAAAASPPEPCVCSQDASFEKVESFLEKTGDCNDEAYLEHKKQLESARSIKDEGLRKSTVMKEKAALFEYALQKMEERAGAPKTAAGPASPPRAETYVNQLATNMGELQMCIDEKKPIGDHKSAVLRMVASAEEMAVLGKKSPSLREHVQALEALCANAKKTPSSIDANAKIVEFAESLSRSVEKLARGFAAAAK